MIYVKRPDMKNADSLLEAARKQIAFTLTLKVSDDAAPTIVRNIYESFRMIGDALLVAKGIKSEDHLEPINELLKLKVKTSRPTSLIESLRRLRHNVNYYGYLSNSSEAEDAVSIAKSCFEPLYESVTKEIRNIGK